MLLIVSPVISCLLFEILTFCLRLTIRMHALMMTNSGAGSSSTENGNNKSNKGWSWAKVFAGATGGALASIAVKWAKARFSEPETSKRAVNNISYKFALKLPFSSACVLGLSFPLGYYILTMPQEKPQVPKPDFIPSAAETSCFENCIYLTKHPWILLLTGLEGIAFILLFGLIVKSIMKNFNFTTKWIKTFASR